MKSGRHTEPLGQARATFNFHEGCEQTAVDENYNSTPATRPYVDLIRLEIEGVDILPFLEAHAGAGVEELTEAVLNNCLDEQKEPI